MNGTFAGTNPAEWGKTTNTTFTTSLQLCTLRVLQSCCKGKQQNTTRVPWMEPSRGHNARRNQLEMCPRRSVVFCCFATSKPWSAWASKRRCPREALFKVVKVVQVVFPFQQAVLETQVPCRSKYRMPPFPPLFPPRGRPCRAIAGRLSEKIRIT